MAMVAVVSGSLYRWTHSLSRLAWFVLVIIIIITYGKFI